MNSSDKSEPSTKPRLSPMAGIKRAIFALGILVIVWFIFGQVVPRFFFEPEPATPEVAQNDEYESRLLVQEQSLKAMEDRISQLEARLKTYEELLSTPKPEPLPASAQEPSEEIKAWQASIEAKLATLQENPTATTATTIDESRISALEARINNQQEAFATIQMQADEKITLTIAIAQLKESLLRGDTYTAPLNVIARLSDSRSDTQLLIESLRTHADSGLTTPEQSKAQFEPLIRKALEHSSKDSLANNVRSLVSVRKVGEPEGSSDEAILARAETKLNRGDMAGTLEELKNLPASAKDVFAAWVKAAQTYQTAADELRALEIALFKPPAPEVTSTSP